jgi:hypothetical protein
MRIADRDVDEKRGYSERGDQEPEEDGDER